MNKNMKLISLIVGGGLVVVVLASVFALSYTSNAWAQDTAPDAEALDFFGHRGGRGFPVNPPVRLDNEFLLDALGISAEELQDAVDEAGKAALETAVAEGMLTQEQADVLLSRGINGRFGMLGGRMGIAESGDYLTFLAGALDVSVEELQSAFADAQSASVAEAVEQGSITQEQADMMIAMQALKDYINPQALFEDVTGMSTEQFHESRQAAFQEAIQSAIEAGVITQEQADHILEGPVGPQGIAPFFKGRGGHGGMTQPDGMPRMPRFQAPRCTDTTSL